MFKATYYIFILYTLLSSGTSAAINKGFTIYDAKQIEENNKILNMLTNSINNNSSLFEFNSIKFALDTSNHINESTSNIINKILEKSPSKESILLELEEQKKIKEEELQRKKEEKEKLEYDKLEYEKKRQEEISTNTFLNVEELKKMNLKKDEIAYTKGYYSNGDNGASEYTIVTTKDKDIANDLLYITLNNGLFAKLNTTKLKSINVMQIGIKTNENCSDKLNALIGLANKLEKGITFNKGTYLIDKRIQLKSIDYIGNNTKLEIAEDYSSNGITFFTNEQEYNTNNTGSAISFKNIEFYIETNSSYKALGEESILVQLKGIEKCIIDNCKFYSSIKSGTEIATPLDLLWFWQGNTQNVTIKNTTFINNVPKETKMERNAGGCIWISCLNKGDLIENIEISNCDFYTDHGDEIIALWKAKNTRNIYIHDSKFKAGGITSGNIVAFNESKYENIKIKNNEFNINTPCVYAIKFTSKNKQSIDAEVTNCTINVNNNCTNTVSENISLFLISGLDNSSESIKLKNNTINFDESSKYRQVVTVVNSTLSDLTITGNDVNAITENGIVSFDNSNGTLNIKNNSLNVGTYLLFQMKNTTPKTTINLMENEIYGRPQGYFQGNMALEYNIYKNHFNAQKHAFLFQRANNMTLVNGEKCVLNIYDNTFTNQKDIDLFYGTNESGKAIPKEDYLEINTNNY